LNFLKISAFTGGTGYHHIAERLIPYQLNLRHRDWSVNVLEP